MEQEEEIDDDPPQWIQFIGTKRFIMILDSRGSYSVKKYHQNLFECISDIIEQ